MIESGITRRMVQWNSSYGEIMNEDVTLRFYRTTYKTKIPKKELEDYLKNLETWEKFAHTNRKLLALTYFLSSGQPYAGLLLNDENAIVDFIDEHNRIYMRYVFVGQYRKDSLFLNSLEYFVYEDDRFYPTFKRRDVIRYQFTPEGKLTVTKRLSNGDGPDTVTIEEADHQVNVSKNWERYPELGKYDGLVVQERWEDEDLLKGIIK